MYNLRNPESRPDPVRYSRPNPESRPENKNVWEDGIEYKNNKFT